MKRLLITLASVAVLAAFSVTPVAAQAGPLWRMNGVLSAPKQIETSSSSARSR